MNSYWNESEKERKYPKLNQSIKADVAIIGGGLTGVQTAYLLANRGLKVVILEKERKQEENMKKLLRLIQLLYWKYKVLELKLVYLLK